MRSGHLADRLRLASTEAVLIAVTMTRTLAGAERLWWAEAAGRRRLPVLRAIDRRIAELGGTQRLESWLQVVAEAHVIEDPRQRAELRRH